MQRTFVAIGCALALAAGSTLAQQQQQSPSAGSAANNSPGPSITEKAKEAAHAIGEKTKEAAEKVKEKAHETAQKAKSSSDDKTAQSSQPGQPGASRADQMQKQADDQYKSARAKCEPIQQKAQKTLCEKQATAAHANAEVDIAKANVAAEGGKTNRMGAGKAQQ
jgi:hypothetical protein